MKEKFVRIREICGGWGLYEPGASTDLKQIYYAASEAGELAKAIILQDIEEIKDGVGDVLVCLINAAEISCGRVVFEINEEWDFEECSIGIAFMELGSAMHYGAYQADFDHLVKNICAVAYQWGLTLDECLDQAISVIEKRKGRIINGAFVKESV